MWVLNERGKYEYGFMEIEKKYTKITKLLIRIIDLGISGLLHRKTYI